MKPLYSFVSKVFLHSFPQKYFYIFTICQLRSQNVEKDKPKGDNCLFDLILYFPSTIFQLNREGSSWVEPDKCVLLKDHNAVTPVRLEPAAPRSRVKHSATWPLRSLQLRVKSFFCILFLKSTFTFLQFCNGVARTLKKIRTPKGDYWNKQRLFSIASLFEMGTSL